MNGLENTIQCERVAVSDKAGVMNISLHDVQSGISNKATADTVPVNVVTLKMLMDKYDIGFVDVLHPYAWPNFDYAGNDLKEFLINQELRCFDMYFKEYYEFEDRAYIGPTLLIRNKDT